MNKKNHFIYMRTFILFLNLYLYSTPGDIDTSYGSNRTGIVTAAIGRSNTLTKVAIQSDDKLLGAGVVTISSSGSGICRFNTDGSLDTEFNRTGYTQLNFGSRTIITSVGLQKENLIIAGGYTIENGITKFLLARCLTDGTLDTSFGKEGYVTTDIDGGSSINSIIIQPDDTIIAVGTAGQGTPGFAVARYNSDGSLDTTFGKAGVAQINPGYVSTANAVAVQNDNKIVVAGFAWNFESNVFALARFNEDGSLDTTFGEKGTVTTSVGYSSQIEALAIQEDGSILVAGHTTDDYIHYSFALARYNENGNLDRTFNETGIVINSLPYSSQLKALVLQREGTILAAGYNFGARTTTFALTRYLNSGLIDTTFGTNGIVLTTIGANAQINGLAIQSDGNLLAAGTSDDYAAVVRYLMN